MSNENDKVKFDLVRPLKSCKVKLRQYSDTKNYYVATEVLGYTSLPCNDDEVELRGYNFINGNEAIVLGLILIKKGIVAIIKNLFR